MRYFIILLICFVVVLPANAMDKAELFSEAWYASMERGIPQEIEKRDEIMKLVSEAANCIGEKMAVTANFDPHFVRSYHDIVTQGKDIGVLVDRYEMESLTVNNLLREAEKTCGVVTQEGGE